MPNPPLANAPAEEVWKLLAELVRPGAIEAEGLHELIGRVLAESVRSPGNYPPFDRASMDGYAVRCADLATGRGVLRATGATRAGVPSGVSVEPGCCMQINTGAPLPAGADAVVMVEKSRPAPEGCIELEDCPRSGQHVQRRASLLGAGDEILPTGARVTPGGLAALAAAGVTRARVYRRPRVALLSTGDELVAPGEDLQAGQIPESNTLAIQHLAARCGATVERLGMAPDDPAVLRERLRGGLQSDLLCVTGGMSKGSHDLVPPALEQLGVRWRVQSLDLKPGKPTRIGRADHGTWVLGLPGNPVSCVVCFLLFGRMILEGLQGVPVRPPEFQMGILRDAIPPAGNRPMFAPARWSTSDAGLPLLDPIRWNGSGDPFGLAQANALLVRPARSAAAAPSETARFLPLDSLS